MNYYCKKEEKLLTNIENLRKQLNKRINTLNNTPQDDPGTHIISKKLDKLIYHYMTTYHR